MGCEDSRVFDFQSKFEAGCIVIGDDGQTFTRSLSTNGEFFPALSHWTTPLAYPEKASRARLLMGGADDFRELA